MKKTKEWVDVVKTTINILLSFLGVIKILIFQFIKLLLNLLDKEE